MRSDRESNGPLSFLFQPSTILFHSFIVCCARNPMLKANLLHSLELDVTESDTEEP